VKIISFVRGAVALAFLTAGVACTVTTPPADPNLPVIFVHGYMGSGAQYRSQALRWASNGFDPSRIRVFNYNSATNDTSRLNAFVDSVRTDLGVSQVNLVGHSTGASVVAGYASTQPAKVGRFILVDGAACPLQSTNCLAIWGAEMDQTHFEAAVSAQSFDRQYRFFTGRAPTTTAITPEPPEQVRISGYALERQTNTPIAGIYRAELYELDTATGTPVGEAKASFTIRADGSWGPVTVDGRRHYEIRVSRGEGMSGYTTHYHFEPFIRSSSFVHLITAPPISADATTTWMSGQYYVSLVVQRQSEFWRSHGLLNDTLRVGTTLRPGADQPDLESPPVNVLPYVLSDVNGVQIHDDKASPWLTTLGVLGYAPFQAAVDVYLPAPDGFVHPPPGTVTITNIHRGDPSKVQRVAVANWRSLYESTHPPGRSAHQIIVELNDYA
jgi:pimeloyl-ACP methyl ester carboxylesterase